MRRGQGHLQRVAGLVAGLVQGQLDLVRARVEPAVVVVPAPAGAERVAHGQPGGRVEHVHPVFAPLHREVEPGGGGADIEGAGFLVLEAAGEIVVPAVVGEGPVVVAQFAHQGDLEPLGRLRLAVGIHAQQLETRVGVGIGTIGVAEQWAHRDQRRCRPQHALEGAGDGAAAGLVDTARDQRRHRRTLADLVRQGDVLAQPAVAGQGGVDHVAGVARQAHGRVAEEPARHRFQRVLLHRHRQPGGEAVAVGRRAVQVRGVGLQLQRFARLERLLCAVQVQLHALGQEFLDAQGQTLHRLLAGRVGTELDLPAAGRRLGRDRLFETKIALRARLQAGFAEHLAVGLLEPQEHRLRALVRRGHRLAVVVAQQRRHAHRLAGAVQVAAGPGEHVEPCVLAPGHGELAQVQRRLVERQHRGVGTAAGHQHVRGVQGVVEQRVAVGVGLALEDGLALAVEHPQLDLLQRRAGGQRGGVHEQLLLVGAGVQADVADGEERGVVLALETAGALHHREVQARLLQLADLLDRQVGQHPFVGLAAEHEAVQVDRLGQLRDRRVLAVVAVQLPAAATAAALVLAEEAGQVLLAHAQEFDVHFRHVDRHHRQAAALARRQHAALRGEAGSRLQFAGEHLLAHFAAQAAAVGGEQVGRDDQGVVLGRLDIGIAQGLAVIGQ